MPNNIEDGRAMRFMKHGTVVFEHLHRHGIGVIWLENIAGDLVVRFMVLGRMIPSSLYALTMDKFRSLTQFTPAQRRFAS